MSAALTPDAEIEKPAADVEKKPEAARQITTTKTSEPAMMTANQARARKQYRSENIRGDGSWCRVSRCLPGAPMVTLFPTADAAERAAASGKKCSEWGCRMLHSTEELDFEDAAPWQK